MFAFTEKNVGKPMAVLFMNAEVVTNYNAKGEPIREHRQVEEVISIASIRGVFAIRSSVTTGAGERERMTRAVAQGRCAGCAGRDRREERTVGPSPVLTTSARVCRPQYWVSARS